jgi:hypothetical protein
MSLTTRTATAVAVLAVAAIPVGALTIKNSSTKPISIAVDNGSQQAGDQAPAWDLSRFVSENATITADGETLVAVAASPEAQSLVPQNPGAEPLDAAASIATGALPDAKPVEAEPTKPAAKVRRPARQAQKGGPSSGSIEMLFSGPKKK